MNMKPYTKKIVLENGQEFYGYGFGADKEAICEIVFNTSMVGYQEIMSDPSYTDQMVVMTYPLIGNYGMTDEDYETKNPTIGGMIVREYNDSPSNFRYTKTLSEVFEEHAIPGIEGVDTRMLTRIIRNEGSQRVMITSVETPREEALARMAATPWPHDMGSRGGCRERGGARIDIEQGRHPVIETLMPVGEKYIPNDIRLDDEEQQIVMITGPNMSGKSALLRQTALIILMAQMGSFVPARRAHIGVVDKIFTRVGASDNISQGESTFMVEMLESASILNNISDRSIVLLDEIGRGTSTYDGISIAWAMVEYLHNHLTAHARTLFATHYHELNEMEKMYPRVKNYHVTVKEMNNTIVFLRKLERGGTEHSFGIHVAKMAGMPASVVSRADEILKNLVKVYGTDEIVPSKSPKLRGRKQASVKDAVEEADKGASMQLSMFQLDDPVLVQIRDQIKGLDIDSLTPLEALNKLNEIKKIAGI